MNNKPSQNFSVSFIKCTNWSTLKFRYKNINPPNKPVAINASTIKLWGYDAWKGEVWIKNPLPNIGDL